MTRLLAATIFGWSVLIIALSIQVLEWSAGKP